MKKKTCTKCLCVKDLNEFYKDKAKCDGFRPDCKACMKEYSDGPEVKQRKREYYKANVEKIKKYSKEYYKDNAEKHLESVKNWRKNNPEKIKEYSKKYRADNPEYFKEYVVKNRQKIKDYGRAWRNQRRQTDPVFKMVDNIRRRINACLTRGGFIKKSNTQDILGCDYEEAFKHLTQTFLINYSRLPNENDDLHIDHVIPLSTAKSEEDIYRLNHISNLQWLLAKDNLEKSDKLDWEINNEEAITCLSA